tara:strand:- start:107 stop:253 length:147 start_codon:yes stop_codon:yes gene_type:complete
MELWLTDLQNLAKFSDSLVRKLLHYVGYGSSSFPERSIGKQVTNDMGF